MRSLMISGRSLTIAGAGLALMAASGAQAGQRGGMTSHGGMASHGGMSTPMMHQGGGTRGGGSWGGTQHWGGQHWGGNTPTVPMRGNRWGSKIGGHWWGGMNAPGGWGAYRRPARGYVLPSYWISPRFYINDWSGYGLTQPAYGYNWVRYYDDAVLIDGRGSVYDVNDGIDWDRYDDTGYADDTAVYAGPADRGYYAGQGGYYDERAAPPAPVGAGYAPSPVYGARYDSNAYQSRRSGSDGVAGAVVGGVVGGVAGNVIAGRGNRLGGTLIGAGVGAAAGYAIDRASHDRGPRYTAPGYDRGGYPVDRGPVGGRYYGGAPYAAPGGTTVTSTGGATVTTTTTGGYAAGGYYFPAGSTTTVVVPQAPVVTTKTVVYDDSVTYSRPRAPRTKVVKRWRAPAKCACR